MNLFILLLIILSLLLGILEISFSIGKTFSRINLKKALKIAAFLVLLQIPALLAGWFSGEKTEFLIKNFDHWIPLTLLPALGLKMIFESIRYFKNFQKFKSVTAVMIPGIILTILFDMVIIGFIIAFLSINFVRVLPLLGFISLITIISGVYWGKSSRSKYGFPIKIIGGLVFIGIGLNYWLTLPF